MSTIGPTFHITTAQNGMRDVWLDFVGDDGKSCSLSISAIAERSGPIVRQALWGWSRRVLDAFEENETTNEHVSDNGQFGVGA